MSEDRRALILKAAERLFHHYGPLKTTVADIAREASVGVGTVYLEFKGKNAILRALSSQGHGSVLAAVEAAWQGDEKAGLRLRRALDARLEAFLVSSDRSLHGADLLHCGGCDPVLKAHRAFKVHELDLFTRFLQEGVDCGDFTVADPRRSARALLTAYATYSPPVVFIRRPEEVRQSIVELHELVLEGLRSRA